MLERKHIKVGGIYLFSGKLMRVYMIHKLGRGEGVSFCDHEEWWSENPFHYPNLTYLQMRKFQKLAQSI